MKLHTLKTVNPYFNDVKNGVKRFEIRKNDRDFKIGDTIELQEFESGNLTGNSMKFKVMYMCDFEQKQDYVVIGLGDYLGNWLAEKQDADKQRG